MKKGFVEVNILEKGVDCVLMVAFLISQKNNYFSIMKATTKNTEPYEITYNPALDYLMDKGLGKKKVDEAREFIKKHGLPERFMKKNNS